MHNRSAIIQHAQWFEPRCLYNKVGFQWVFFVSCGSPKISATRWRSNQVTAVRAANARWHPTAIICTQDGAAPHLISFCDVSKKCYRCRRLNTTCTAQWFKPRCLYNKVGFQWGFFVSCGSQKISATRWRSNQVTAVQAVNARWHPTAIICTRDGAAPTWSHFAMFQKKISLL
jgi:hypothetical protein